QEQVVVVRLNNRLRETPELLKQKLESRTDILSVATSSQVPGIPFAPREYSAEGSAGSPILTNTLWMDEDYLSTMQIELRAGRGFQAERPSERQRGFILNRAAVGHFGWEDPDDAVGKIISTPGENGITGRVIGVTENFNYESLHNEIKPLVMRYRASQNFLSARISDRQVMNTMDYLESQWNAVAPDDPFVSWFLDEQLQNQYESETRLSTLFMYFSGLAILIACLGLFGLASFSIQRRIREIGIRKILGASVSRIVLLFTGEYVLLLLVANLVAWPLGYITVNHWLEEFAYRVEIGSLLFLMAGLLVVTIAILTISVQTIRTGLTNPVESLRNE
ncbi:MAG: FtsX-like permease family protein, partial [Balneolaceae bacterium]|nr:FtsX-like permease family protein [Balneolaceae bacterium]